MSATSDILRAGTAAQALGLLSHNVAYARKRKKKAKDFIGLAGTNIVGSSLLQAQSEILGGL